MTRNLQVLSSLHLHVIKILIRKATSLHALLSALSMNLISLQESLMSLKTDISWITKSTKYQVNIPGALTRILKKWIDENKKKTKQFELIRGNIRLWSVFLVYNWNDQCVCVRLSACELLGFFAFWWAHFHQPVIHLSNNLLCSISEYLGKLVINL